MRGQFCTLTPLPLSRLWVPGQIMYSFKSLRSIIFISIKFGDKKNMILFILTMLLSHPNQYQPNDFNDNKQVILTINII